MTVLINVRQAFDRGRYRALQAATDYNTTDMGDKLQLYVSVSMKMATTILLVEKDKQQYPIYFVSHVYAGADQRYELLERRWRISCWKWQEISSHTSTSIPSRYSPINHWRTVLHKLDTTGKLLKWTIELSEFDTEYRPHRSIKAQALADFIVETTYEDTEELADTWLVL